jgi:hypothetical protein
LTQSLPHLESPIVLYDDEALDQLLADWPIEATAHSPIQDKHLSPSQIKMASRCLEQFRRRYVLGEKEPPAGALLWGRCDHSSVEYAMRERLAEKPYPSKPDLQELFVANLVAAVDESGGESQVEWKEEGGLAEVKDRGAALVGAYRDLVIPTMEPVAVEEPFTVTVPGVPVPLSGFLDLTARVDATGGRKPRLVERKTSARNGVSGEWVVQTRIGQLAKPLEADIQLSLKTKEPRVVHGVNLYPAPPPALVHAQVQRVVAQIALAYSRYGPDDVWPDAIGSGHACTWCAWGPKGTGACAWWNTAAWPTTRRTLF